jgi:hypothetical protein
VGNVRTRCRDCKNGVQKTTQQGDREIDREYMMSVIASSTDSGQSKQLWGGGVCISVQRGLSGGKGNTMYRGFFPTPTRTGSRGPEMFSRKIISVKLSVCSKVWPYESLDFRLGLGQPQTSRIHRSIGTSCFMILTIQGWVDISFGVGRRAGSTRRLRGIKSNGTRGRRVKDRTSL